MFMLIAATGMILVFMVVFSEVYQDNLRDKKAIVMQDYGYSLQSEFILAAEARPGYERNFTVPTKLDSFDFSAYILKRTLIINYTDNIFALPVPNITGNLQAGVNRIVHENNSICLNC